MCAGYETGAKNAFKHIDQCSRFEMPGKIGLQINQLCEFETRATTDLARGAGWGTNLSHRSGGTIDSFIADVTVATCAGKLKTGAPCRGEWVEKSNQLLRIEEEPGGRTVYAGRKASVR
jgi:enolase